MASSSFSLSIDGYQVLRYCLVPSKVYTTKREPYKGNKLYECHKYPNGCGFFEPKDVYDEAIKKVRVQAMEEAHEMSNANSVRQEAQGMTNARSLSTIDADEKFIKRIKAVEKINPNMLWMVKVILLGVALNLLMLLVLIHGKWIVMKSGGNVHGWPYFQLKLHLSRYPYACFMTDMLLLKF